ncbi:MAG TPA: VOC family protein [Chloroflexota bacterium]|nr:VOC family protein [Chloroflexota bacterium]
MTNKIKTGAIHHMTLTVTNLPRAISFYTDLLGFQMIMELSPTRVLLSNGGAIVALSLPPDPALALPNDRFNENRAGLDHASFSVGTLAELETAVRLFDERGVSHGEIKDLGSGLKLYVLAFRDPDNIQLELTAPYSQV